MWLVVCHSCKASFSPSPKLVVSITDNTHIVLVCPDCRSTSGYDTEEFRFIDVFQPLGRRAAASGG